MSTMAYICLLAGLVSAATVTFGAEVPTSGHCINVTIRDVMGIGECLGTSNFCDSSTGLNGAAMKITQCAAEGVFKHVPHDVIITVLPLLTTLLPAGGLHGGFNFAVLLPLLADLGNMNLCGANGCGFGSTESDRCAGSVTVTLPSLDNLDKCFDNVTLGCVQGSTNKIDGFQSVMQAMICTIYELPGSPLAHLHRTIGCALVNALKAAEKKNPDVQMVLFAFESAVRNTLDIYDC
ncbi:hypothetical protein MRX96_034175 [Rhipicephalus microplus]